MDLLAAGYSGFCYIMYGNKDGSLNDTITLKDKAGNLIHLGTFYKRELGYVVEGDDYMSGRFVKAHDWDNDGDLDLIISIDGTAFGLKGAIGKKYVSGTGVKLRINEGTKTNPVFGTENIDVVPAHYADALVDWDGDGLWDIIGGSKEGGVYFYKNLGKLGEPQFGEAKCLIEPSEFVNKKSGGQCGITQLTVADYNNDGKLDLIIGSNTLTIKGTPNYTKAEIKEREEIQKLYAECLYESNVIRIKYKKKYGNDMAKINKAMMKDKAYLKLQKKREKLDMQRLAELSPEVEAHGYVWVSLRE